VQNVLFLLTFSSTCIFIAPLKIHIGGFLSGAVAFYQNSLSSENGIFVAFCLMALSLFVCRKYITALLSV